ncbi:hypothetical protein [Streptomyces sp. NPDC095613]|uniref:hypothetical protein n=1 Tax=Streptomyces sp. NPDC095613 TaxID=3155540 RepID=UPI00332B2CEE
MAVAAVDDMAADEAGPRSIAATEAPRVLAAIDDQAVRDRRHQEGNRITVLVSND